MKVLLLTLLAISSLFANKFYYEFGKKVEIDSSIATKKSFSTTDTNPINQYTTKDGKTIKFKNEILVQCKTNAYCEDDFADLSLSNYKKIGSSYFLITTSSSNDIFLIMQQLDAKADVETAHPNYVRDRFKR